MRTLPTSVIDLLGTVEFQDLASTQQQEVLQYMNEAEYRQLRLIYLRIGQQSQEETAALAAPPELKTSLMDKFREKHPVRIPVYQRNIPAWQVAALLVLLMIPVFVLRPAPITKIEYVAQRDTVLKEVPVIERITVDCPPAPASINTPVLVQYPRIPKRRSSAKSQLPGASDINIQSLDELKTPNLKPGTSMADDPLIKQFPAVSL